MRNIIIDVETDRTISQIWCAVTKDLTNKEEAKVWTQASELQKYLRPNDILIGHNIIGFDAPVLRKHWNLNIDIKPTARHIINVKATKPSSRRRTLAKIMGLTLRKAQRRLHCFRWRAM